MEAITQKLSVARSNVSNSLRELQRWGVVKVVHVMGDRRDHYECISNVWEMIRVIIDERKKREFDPTLKVLRELAASAKKSGSKDANTHERIVEMLSFYESIATWYSQIKRLPTGSVIKFVKMGNKVKARLIAEMGSQVHDVAIAATDKLRQRGGLRMVRCTGLSWGEPICE